VFRRNLVHTGVGLVRLASLSIKRKSRIFADELAAQGHETQATFSLITAEHMVMFEGESVGV
jgi:hypothetical protein